MARGEEFRRWFAQKFGAAFPVALQGAEELVRTPLEGEVFASESVVPSLQYPPMSPEFREEAGDHVIAGHWGRSLNTFAFYWVEVRGTHRRFFRIHCGGAYGDWEKEAAAVVATLSAYERWRGQYESKLAASILTHNMGVDRAELTSADGRNILVENYDEGVDFWKKVAAELG